MALRSTSNPGTAPADRVAALDCAPSPSKSSTGTSVFAKRGLLYRRADILVRERAAAGENIRHAHDRTRRDARAGDSAGFADQVDAVWAVAGQGRIERIRGIPVGVAQRRLLRLQIDQAHHAASRPA